MRTRRRYVGGIYAGTSDGAAPFLRAYTAPISRWDLRKKATGILVTVWRHSGGMESHRYADLSAKAAERHGVFSLRDTRELNIADSTVRDGVAAGRYRRLEPGVYAINGSPRSLQQLLSGVTLSFPALAAVSHQTAAEVWGLTDRGVRVIDVVTTRWDRVHRSAVQVHESLDLIDEDVTHKDGLAVTTPVRTVVDLGASNRWLVESALEQGIRRGLFSLADIEAFVARVARRGRRGVGVIRPLLEARRHWDSSTESALEDEFKKLVTESGLPRPQFQFVLRDRWDSFVCRADFAYPDARILIELDSEAHHLDRMAFRRDRSKQNQAVVLGWTVLRYTWWDLVEDPGRVCSEINAALIAA